MLLKGVMWGQHVQPTKIKTEAPEPAQKGFALGCGAGQCSGEGVPPPGRGSGFDTRCPQCARRRPKTGLLPKVLSDTPNGSACTEWLKSKIVCLRSCFGPNFPVSNYLINQPFWSVCEYPRHSR